MQNNDAERVLGLGAGMAPDRRVLRQVAHLASHDCKAATFLSGTGDRYSSTGMWRRP